MAGYTFSRPEIASQSLACAFKPYRQDDKVVATRQPASQGVNFAARQDFGQPRLSSCTAARGNFRCSLGHDSVLCRTTCCTSASKLLTTNAFLHGLLRKAILWVGGSLLFKSLTAADSLEQIRSIADLRQIVGIFLIGGILRQRLANKSRPCNRPVGPQSLLRTTKDQYMTVKE